MPESEQRAVEAFLAEHKDSIPGGPYEWDRIEGGGSMGGMKKQRPRDTTQIFEDAVGAAADEWAKKALSVRRTTDTWFFYYLPNGEKFGVFGEDEDVPKGWQLVTSERIPSNLERRGVHAWMRKLAGRIPFFDPALGGHDDDIEAESDEPEEGDWTTEDHRRFYSYGKLVLALPADTGECEMWAAIEARMKKDGFWPNTWFISDHGNAHIMTNPGSKVCRPPRKKKGKKKREAKLGGLSSEFTRDCGPSGCEVKRR